MPEIKKAPVPKFEEYIKKSITNLELIRTKQEEKQAVIDEYEKQYGRYAGGEISKNAFEISVKQNRALLSKIDSQIKSSINTSKSALQNALQITTSQAPKPFNVSVEGLKGPAKRAIKSIKSKVKPASKTVKKAVKKLKPRKR